MLANIPWTPPLLPMPATLPYYVRATGLAVGTSGAPADIGTVQIVLPPGATHWIVGGGWVAGPPAWQPNFLVDDTGSGLTATFQLYTAADGGGSALMPASTVAPVLGSATPLGTVSSTTGTPVRSETVLYVRQVTDSAVAGTISVYLLIVPLP